MSAQHTPGPWQIVENKGVDGWPAGFYVYRTTPDGNHTEWMTQRGGIRPFYTEAAARAAIAKATDPRARYVDCGECPRISTGCKDRCAKAGGA